MNTGWKKIVINSNVDLHRSENCLLVIKDKETQRIPINQINMIIIESEQVTLTSSLMIFLVENNVNLIFCDCKHNPYFEAIPYSKNIYSTARLNEQVNWKNERKDSINYNILQLKIQNQANLLKKVGAVEYVYLEALLNDIESENALDVEAEAAKIYFHRLFGAGFRRRTDNNINFALNYGYSILLSNINRIIVSHGYNTCIGLNHHNCRNHFNLSCDIIEPFRPFVDQIVYENMNSDFDNYYKKRILSVCSTEIRYNNSIVTIENALELFTMSVIMRMKDELAFKEVIDFA